ncbi:TPA: hypothetical protein VMZ07_000965 [Streptococcus pyogenes]|nr:hypothetical protein [Streptococcus pyogenes]QBX28775.1 hypothetical protein Javan464_0060 [Streptococcus phage Javan464]VGU01596.1 Uncharacterised protein [Streptococcus pyogenes]VHE56524.1 Uncharacterised protein [Streptococcus pyogenes]VHG16999.1 Uncharacterised protein [Streptococcus pyogenes]VHG64365.1 Uncharacterised protein [Streptococcus pyogenes]
MRPKRYPYIQKRPADKLVIKTEDSKAVIEITSRNVTISGQSIIGV